MIGIPLTAGFWSKFYLAEGAIAGGHPAVVVVLLISSLMTAMYSWHLLQLVWFAPEDVEPKVTAEAPWSMRVPALILGGLCLFLGLFTMHIDVMREAAAELLR
jgi:multicomponent Na+:H+ antiporter subunit D